MSHSQRPAFQSPPLEEAEALDRILSEVPTGRADRVALASCPGRFSLETRTATVAHPGFDQSAMDGYAVRHSDAVAGAELEVVGEQPAGRDRGLAVAPGMAVRVFTGAPVPSGATAVVMQEDTERAAAAGGGLPRVRLRCGADDGEFIRRRGADVCPGQVLVRQGDALTPQLVGLLASQGIGEIATGCWPSVAVLVTGDEVREPGEVDTLEPGEVFNSNGPMLEALVRAAGASEVDRAHARDDLAATADAVGRAASRADVVIVSGGVSVGDHDHVKDAIGGAGFSSAFWRVRMKPGKPFLFGIHESGQKLLFGLPGNPVSAFVTAVVFVLPALRRWAGAGREQCRGLTLRCRAGAGLGDPGDRPHYLRGRVGPGGEFVPAGIQQSHAIAGLASANALAKVEPGERVPAGGLVDVRLL